MRKLLFASLAAFLFCVCVARAADTARIPLLNGIYSLEAPTDWHVEQEPEGQSVMFSPEQGASQMVVVTAPNITVGDDYAEYAGIQIGILFKLMGGGKVTAEEKGETDGFPSVAFSFSIPSGDSTIEGRANVVDFDGAAVLFIAICPADQLDEFLPAAGDIIDSYQLHPEAIEENKQVLADVAEKINQEIKDKLKQ